MRAVCTTREGGISRGAFASLNLGGRDDAPAAIAENRRRLAAALGLRGAPQWLSQVHGTRVLEAPFAQPHPEADASFTTALRVACAVQAADCLPVLFCDEQASVVAAAHAGWRGLAAGVLEATVARLPAPASRLMAWLGPAIGPGHFEVGAEVRKAFIEVDAGAAEAFWAGARPQYWFADLFALARRRLARAGVAQIYGGGLCTYSDPARFFSYRRDGATGRIAALIWRQET